MIFCSSSFDLSKGHFLCPDETVRISSVIVRIVVRAMKMSLSVVRRTKHVTG